MFKPLMNKITLISGAGDGLGRELALQLGKDKNNLILVSKSDNVFDVKKKILKYHKDCIAIKCNITNFTELEKELSNVALINVDRVDMVLCAGIVGKTGGILDSDLIDWSNTFNVNVLGNLNILRFFLQQHNIVTKSIFISGGGSAYGYPELFGYSLSKTALVRAVENISIELAKINNKHITHIIAPGAMQTKMLETVKSTGANIKTTVPIIETIKFIKKLLTNDFHNLNGKFFHVRDDLENLCLGKEKWLLRRIT